MKTNFFSIAYLLAGLSVPVLVSADPASATGGAARDGARALEATRAAILGELRHNLESGPFAPRHGVPLFGVDDPDTRRAREEQTGIAAREDPAAPGG